MKTQLDDGRFRRGVGLQTTLGKRAPMPVSRWEERDFLRIACILQMVIIISLLKLTLLRRNPFLLLCHFHEFVLRH